MSEIGVVPMSAKPYHVGHDMLIRLAAEERDEVIVYASSGDRARPGEFPIKGSTMRRVWLEHVVGTLPGNVVVEFVPNPVSAVYALIGATDKDPTDGRAYTVYSDPADLKRNFPPANFAKYAPRLAASKSIKRRSVPRSSTVEVSGTQMRAWLTTGDKIKFVAHLPEGIDGEAVWKMLTR